QTGVTSIGAGVRKESYKFDDSDSGFDSFTSGRKINRGFSTAASFSKPKPSVSSADFKIGDTVIHKIFGTGVVLNIQPIANDTLLEIAFDKAGTKKLMANFAKLTKG
ncbi:MAG: hypothetical protein IJU45_02055, partial [Clostridia bacterium]|nr:hypothetical protein [Clostridia bacterium]